MHKHMLAHIYTLKWCCGNFVSLTASGHNKKHPSCFCFNLPWFCLFDTIICQSFTTEFWVHYSSINILDCSMPRSGGSVVSVSDSWPGGCEFDPRLRQLFFPAYFRLSPLQKHVRKVVDGFGKKSCVSTGVRKPGSTCVLPTAMIWP